MQQGLFRRHVLVQAPATVQGVPAGQASLLPGCVCSCCLATQTCRLVSGVALVALPGHAQHAGRPDVQLHAGVWYVVCMRDGAAACCVESMVGWPLATAACSVLSMRGGYCVKVPWQLAAWGAWGRAWLPVSTRRHPAAALLQLQLSHGGGHQCVVAGRQRSVSCACCGRCGCYQLLSAVITVCRETFHVWATGTC
jgi:hypothetical protein